MTGATPNEKTKTSNNYKSGFIDSNSLVKSPPRKEIQEVVQSNVTMRSVDPSLEQTISKQYLAIVLDRSWKLVQDLINDKGLQSCEVGLREATSLLVLATLRGAADVYASSKATVEWMFRSADVNHDGQLTYVEWYDWLMQRDRLNNHEEGGNSLIQAFNPLTGEKIIFPPDPMILDLEQVLSHAVTSLYYTSRLSDDPNVLIAAYISAGMTPGILDPSFSGTMLSRLPGVIRELIIHAITLEATKITAASSSSFFLPTSPKPALIEGEQTKVGKRVTKASKTLNATSTTSTVVLQPFNMDRKSYLQSYGYKRRKFKKIIHDIAPPPPDTSKSVESQLLPLSSSSLISPSNATNSLLNNKSSSGLLPSGESDPTLPEKKNLVGKRVVYIKPRKRSTLQPVLQAKSLVHQHLAHTKQVVEDVLLTLPSSNRDAMKANQIANSSVFVSKTAPFPQDDDDVGIVTYDGYDVMIEPSNAADHDSEIISESVIHRENKSNNEIQRKENSLKVSAVVDASDGLTLENQNLYKREIVLRMSANIDSERSVALPPSALKNSLSSSQSSTAISSSSLLSPSISSSKSTASTIVIEIDEDNEELIRSYERFIQEMNQLQESITEFDDQECKQLRQLLANRLQEIGPNQESIMAIILSLRLSRLQNLQRDDGSVSSSNLFPSPIPASSFSNFAASAASLSLLSSRSQDHYKKNPHHPSHIFHNRKKFFKAFQQQLAMETIQIWSPLSHQFEFSKLLPELELQSFYYLFPRSFHSFLTWYQLFYPLANRIIQKFQSQFVSIIRNDPLILKYCNKMIIDSRIKSEHSSYTKMFQQAKQRDDLFDLIGIRVIFSVISHSTTTPSPSTSSSRRKRKNSNIEVEESIVTVDVIKSNEKVNEEESDGYEDALYDTSEDDDDSVGHEFSEEYRQHYNDTEIIISRSNKPVAAEELPEEITQHLEELRQRRLEQSFQKQSGSGANIKHKRKRNDQSEKKRRQDIHFDTPKQKDNRGGKGSSTGVSNTMTVEECLVLNRIKEIVKELTEWDEDLSRFKDYVTHPKASGYQSIHMNFVHQPTKFRIELQIRSERMHYNAEFGTASHKYYKALLLPSSIKRQEAREATQTI